MPARTMRGLVAIAACISAIAVVGPSPASAAGKGNAAVTPTTTTPKTMEKPMYMPISRHPEPLTTKSGVRAATCVDTSATTSACITPIKPHKQSAPNTLAVIPFPSWCAESGGSPIAGSRTEVCQISGLLLTTRQTVNGTTTVTGEVSMDVYDYTYSSVDLPNWAHQIGISPWSGWGAALTASVTGTLSVAGACTINGSSFPAQPLSPANNIMRTGNGGARTTATAVGAIGNCTTTWNLVFNTPGYPSTTASSSMSDIDCDNATGANGARPARVGCVVWWYPATVYYSRSSYPSLASHVSRAQGSGLPGTTFANPLNRNTTATANTNRTLACGDAPSISGKSCDEYPLASTYQGLAYGGSRRTFTGCNIKAPTGVTGPTGASACMITASENNAQGGIMAAFNYDNRVLNGDPFLVNISS